MVDLFSPCGLLLAFYLVMVNGGLVAAELAFVKFRVPGQRARRTWQAKENTRTGCHPALGRLSGGQSTRHHTLLARSRLDRRTGCCSSHRTRPRPGGSPGNGPSRCVRPRIRLHHVPPRSVRRTCAGDVCHPGSPAYRAPRCTADEVFLLVFVPGIVVFNGTANYFTRLAGVSPASDSEGTHTEEEIRMLLTRSEETGHIDVGGVEMIERGPNSVTRSLARSWFRVRTSRPSPPRCHFQTSGRLL